MLGSFSNELSSSNMIEFSFRTDECNDLHNLGESSKVLKQIWSSNTTKFWDKSKKSFVMLRALDEKESLIFEHFELARLVTHRVYVKFGLFVNMWCVKQEKHKKGIQLCF